MTLWFRKNQLNTSTQTLKTLSNKFISGFAKLDDINEWQYHLDIVKQGIQLQIEHRFYLDFESIFLDYLLVYHPNHDILKAKFGDEVQTVRRSLLRRYIIQTLAEWLLAVDAKRVLQNTRDIRNTWIWRETEPISKVMNKGRGWFEFVPYACNETGKFIDMINKIMEYVQYPEGRIVRLTNKCNQATNGELMSLFEEIGDKTHYFVKPHRWYSFLKRTNYHWQYRELGLRQIPSKLFKSQDEWTEYLVQRA